MNLEPLDGHSQHLFSSHCLYLDIKDLITYLAVNSRLSGIQRVVAGALFEEWTAFDVRPCIMNSSSSARVFRIDDVRYILSICKFSGDIRGLLDAAIAKLYTYQFEAELEADDVYLVLGTFWIDKNFSTDQYLRKNKNILNVLFIHDLFPITRPNFFDSNISLSFEREFLSSAQNTNLFICASDFVKSGVASVLYEEFKIKARIYTVGLAEDLSSASNWHEIKPPAQKFVLSVGTREIRKNHVLLLRAWIVLLRTMPSIIVPKLVIVGRTGWKTEEFDALVLSTNSLDGHLVMLEDISDDDLNILYRSCLFTVYPSFVEGWGIPVAESLSFGKVCVCSATGALPEVGKDFVVYIDPNDHYSLVKAVKLLVIDDLLICKERKIVSDYVKFTWKSVIKNIEAAIIALL